LLFIKIKKVLSKQKMINKIQSTLVINKIFIAVIFIGSLIIPFKNISAQNSIPKNNYNEARLKTVVITESVLTTVGLIGLNYLWYKKFPRSHFHFFNDSNEWLNMDKAGHATTAYNMSSIQYNMMRWSGVNNKSSIWIGGLTALGFQTIIEILDGFSSNWGFSKSDMLANILGTTLFMSQQFAFNEQRVQLKFSFHKTIFAKYNPNELGKDKWQRWLKDYNGQTYWLSINPSSFMKSNTSFPSWLNASFGYGADGMIGAVKNPTEINKQPIPFFKRHRQYYFSLDADFKRFNNDNTSAKALLALPQILKVPFPALEFDKDAPVIVHWFYF